jgi:hypothetical protein
MRGVFLVRQSTFFRSRHLLSIAEWGGVKGLRKNKFLLQKFIFSPLTQGAPRSDMFLVSVSGKTVASLTKSAELNYLC